MPALISINPDHVIDEDRLSGLIHIRVSGFFDLQSLHEHFTDNSEVVTRWRAAGRSIRVLIDAVHLKPHTPEGQACVQDATARIYRSGDKVAILVSSSLVKMQMRRALAQGEIVDFFISKIAALTWLDAQGPLPLPAGEARH